MSTESTSTERNLRKERIGVVTSNSMTKSITVTVERKEKHAKYGKFVKKLIGKVVCSALNSI